MALTYTPAPELGTPCPAFHLKSATDQKEFSLQSYAGTKALVVMFICNHCPYVKAVEDRLLDLAREFIPKGVGFAAICSNDSKNYPEDSPENLKKRALEKDYPFPYLLDLDQTVARAFGAVCTPDFFVYDAHQRLAYRGRLDDSWKDPSAVKSRELRDALANLLAGTPPGPEQKPSMGCSIKWL